MADPSAGHKPATALKEFFFYVLLLVLAFAFFATVRNNGFWHPGDYLSLLKALRISQDWREVFVIAPMGTFQPLVNAVFYVEFSLFGDNPTGYYFFNIIVHALNAYLVYRIVHTLLKDRTIAVMSGLLFVFAVGNYGRAV